MITQDNYDEYEEVPDVDETLDVEFVEDNNFDDVLTLTEYTESGELRNSNSFVVAEYQNIDITTVSKNHQKIAKSFVQKVTKFILDFNDITLNDDHKKYLTEVGNLEISRLADMLSMVEINKQMLENMVRRVNSVQAEDYAMVQTYISLSNQHLKLYKELQNTYKNIPSVLRKMRLEVLDTNNLIETGGEEVITENFGETQFNNSKQMLKQLKEKQAQRIADNNAT